ncbi:MAG: hypothetical protein ABSG86_02500 [Thermoguttaceae bacterium]|jgi:hypothetical protein
MTQQAADVYGTAFKNGSVTLMARVLGYGGAAIHQADIAAAVYSIYFLEEDDANARLPVSGHQDVSLSPAGVVLEELASGPPWDAASDPAGYNFCHTPDVSQYPAFPVAGVSCLVEYRLTTANPAGAGQPILVRFRINVI